MIILPPDPGRQQAHRIDVTISHRHAGVRLSGELDLIAVDSLTRLLDSLDRLDLPVNVDMSGVTFLDTRGISPLIEATRRRAEGHRPPILIGTCSNRARQFLDIARLGGDPYLDLAAWDRLQPSEEWIETRCH